MAHDNFEEILKRKLEQRRMEPGENPWERISARKKPARATRSSYYWIPAACIVLLLGWFWMDRSGNVTGPHRVAVPVAEQEKEATAIIPGRESGNLPAPIPPRSNGIGAAPPPDTLSVQGHVVAVVPITETPHATEERKITEIITELDQLQQSGQAITEATVDSLLAKAQRELALEKQQRRATDPDRLLAESESELDMSFKDRVFAAISKFKKVRIAVGDH